MTVFMLSASFAVCLCAEQWNMWYPYMLWCPTINGHGSQICCLYLKSTMGKPYWIL